MSDRQHVGDASVKCPECGDLVAIPVYAELLQSEDGGQEISTASDPTVLWTHYETHAFAEPNPAADATAVERAADWLEAIREHQWNGNERRPSNYKRAAADLRRYAAGIRQGSS